MRVARPVQPLLFELCKARRDLLLGDQPAVRLTARPARALATERQAPPTSSSGRHRRLHVRAIAVDVGRANATVAAVLPGVADAQARHENDGSALEGKRVTPNAVCCRGSPQRAQPLPEVDTAAPWPEIRRSLPARLAVKTLAERLAGHNAAHTVFLTERRRLVNP